MTQQRSPLDLSRPGAEPAAPVSTASHPFATVLARLAVPGRSFWAAPEGTISAGTGGVEALAKLAGLAAMTTAMIYVQILLGAVMRHNGAGLAIPDFPLAFGRLVPPHFDFKIGIHYAHRLGALTVAILVLWTATRVLSRFRAERTLALPALGMVGLVALQLTLGAL